MTSKTRSTTTTALAVAITAVIAAAPSYAALKAPAAGKAPATTRSVAPTAAKFAKPGHPYGINLKAPATQSYNQFIVTLKSGVKPNAEMQRQLDAVGRLLGTRIAVERTLGTGAQLISLGRDITVSERKQLESELMKHPSILAVEPNGRLYRAHVPNDPLFAQQWHYLGDGMGINATEAWDTVDGTGFIVAVLDTGQVNHADLAGQFVAGYDFISDPANARDGDGRDADPNDEGDWDDKYDSSWHGTHVAGTVAAVTDNNLGVAGVAHGAKVQHVRVLGNMGGTFADISDAIVWASGGTVPGVPANPTPANIINMSLGGATVCPTAMQQAITGAISRGTTVVAAAGNSNANVSGFSPAGCDGVIAVAGTGPDNTRYASTNFGTRINVAAPAGSGVQPATNQVLSTLNTGTEGQAADAYAWYAGTSMAAPHVAGTAALMMHAAGEALPPDEVETILENTAWASNGTVAGCDNVTRWCASLIDAGYAVAVASGVEELPDDPPPAPEPPEPTALENGVAVPVGAMSAGAELMYTLQVPAGQGNVTFDLTPLAGAVGDSDLYVRRGQAPTDTAFDCRSWNGEVAAETCSINNPQSGTWYVRVVAYEASDGYEVKGTYGGEVVLPPTTALVNGQTVELGSMAANEPVYFSLEVPAEATQAEFRLTPGAGATGDTDLFVLFGEHPSATAYDCRPFRGGTNEEVCTFSPSQAGTYFVRINAWNASNGYSLTGTHNGTPPPEGEPTALAARHPFALKGQRIRVQLSWTNGDVEDVEVKFNGAVVGTSTTGKFTHTFTADAVGPGNATFQVCNAGSSDCSESISVDYNARR